MFQKGGCDDSPKNLSVNSSIFSLMWRTSELEPFSTDHYK